MTNPRMSTEKLEEFTKDQIRKFEEIQKSIIAFRKDYTISASEVREELSKNAFNVTSRDNYKKLIQKRAEILDKLNKQDYVLTTDVVSQSKELLKLKNEIAKHKSLFASLEAELHATAALLEKKLNVPRARL